MTWGTACADIWKFGTFTTYPGSTGKNAPSAGGETEIDNTDDSILTLTPIGTPSDATYNIVVNQLASAMIQRSSNSGIQEATVLNGGNSFDVTITPESGAPVTFTMPAGSTLGDVKDEIANQGFAPAIDAVNGTTDSLSVTGTVGDGNDFTITTQARDGSGDLVDTGFPAFIPVPVTELDFSPPVPVEVSPGVWETPLGAQSQDAQYTINGTPYTSVTNTVTQGDFTFTLLDDGTTTVTVQTVSGSIPNGADGNTGNAATNASASRSSSCA